MALVVGPILGFRGSEKGKWRTCALVVTTTGDAAPPELVGPGLCANYPAPPRSPGGLLRAFGRL
jgi:hypothetical protein